jgi:DNA mismatch endonuclease, patch repair protein
MRGNRRRDTRPERAVRSALHRVGLRFRVDLPIQVGGGRSIRPDLVFPRQRVAVFVDGCFWHGCPDHGTRPVTNADYWLLKIEANRRRDRRNTVTLEAHGWTVFRMWEHEDPALVVERVAGAVASTPRDTRRG